MVRIWKSEHNSGVCRLPPSLGSLGSDSGLQAFEASALTELCCCPVYSEEAIKCICYM